MSLPRLPNDFTSEARRLAGELEADPSLRPLDRLSSVTDIAPGERVYAEPDGSFKGRHNGVVFGYTRPHGYAYVLTREGEWLMVNPESLVRKCARTQCESLATSGPNVHSHNWRYCARCAGRINQAAGRVIVPKQRHDP